MEAARLARAKALASIDPRWSEPPPGAVMADPEQLRHNNTYDALPRFYVDKAITCRQCGKEEVWSAERQKWWYEQAKGNINTTAVLCRACRRIEADRKDAARRTHLDGLAARESGDKR